MDRFHWSVSHDRLAYVTMSPNRKLFPLKVNICRLRHTNVHVYLLHDRDKLQH